MRKNIMAGNKFLAAICFLVLCSNLSYAQNDDNIDEWGLGIISREGFENKSEIINFPIGEIDAYNRPGGDIIGKISKAKEYEDPIFNVYLELKDKKEKIRMARSDFREINYEGGCLKYYEIKDSFVNILKYTHDNGVWVKTEDLKNREYVPLTWREFLLANKTSFFPILDKPVTLRISPDPNSEAIINLDSHWFTINITGEIKDNWFKVEVELYSDSPCETKVELLKTYDGWIQAIDKNGHPLIWYFTRGC